MRLAEDAGFLELVGNYVKLPKDAAPLRCEVFRFLKYVSCYFWSSLAWISSMGVWPQSSAIMSGFSFLVCIVNGSSR